MADRLNDLKILHRERFPVRDFFIRYGKDLQMVQHCPDEDMQSCIEESGIHRPGLAMAGYTKVYSSHKNIMNMKDLKMYEAPVLEVVELEAKTVLLAGSTDGHEIHEDSPIVDD